MATTNQDVKDFFNNCILDDGYEVGALPSMDNAKFLRLSTYVGWQENFLTPSGDLTGATADQLVVFMYKKLRDGVRDYETGQVVIAEY